MGCCSNRSTAVRADSSPSEAENKMWVLKISDFITMSGAPLHHEELQEQGLLHEWDPSFFTVLVSHEWLAQDHPDPKGYQCHCLRMAIFNIIDGSLRVEYDALAQSLGFQRHLSTSEKEQIRHGYIWMDWYSIPQTRNTLHASIVKLKECMPGYVERCDLFCILAPTLHNSSRRHVAFSYQTWQSRGWCRAEVWFRQISSKQRRSNAASLPMLLISGDEGVKFLRAHFWLYATVHEGGFTIEEDREGLKPIMEFFLRERLADLLLLQKLDEFRYFLGRFERITGSAPKTRSFEEFLTDFQFNQRSLGQTKGIGPLACAVLSGDVELIPTLVQRRANLHCRASKNLDLDIIPGLTPLHFAAKHACDPAAIMALLALRADVNETDAIGTSVIGHAGTKEIAKLLIEMEADVNQRKPPFGMPPLSACILRPLEPEGLSIMIESRAEPNCGAGMYSLSPLSTATTFPGMPHGTEIMQLLLRARADVNYRESFYRSLAVSARLLCNLQRRPSVLVKGIADCTGSTPLYIAAWFGNPEAVNLLLQARADPEINNDRGERYLDVLNQHNCFNISTAMTWQVRSESAWTEVLLAERPTRMESFASSGSARSTRSTRLRTGRARGRGSGARSSRASSAEPAEVESGPDIVATEL